MEKKDKIYVAGHSGMVGSAIVRKLKSEGFENILTISSGDLDLRNQEYVNQFFIKEKPEIQDQLKILYETSSLPSNGLVIRSEFSKAEKKEIFDSIIFETNEEKQVKIIIGQRLMPKRFHIHLALFKLITWA